MVGGKRGNDMKIGIKKTGIRKIGIRSIRKGIKDGIKNKRHLITGLILAGLMMTGTLQQQVYADSLKQESPASAVEKIADQAVSKMVSGVQELASRALEKASGEKEAETAAEEQAHLRNWRARGYLAALPRATMFAEILITLERNPKVFRHPLL